MPRKKLNSDALAKANERAVNLQSIDPNLDLGNGLTLAAYMEAIAALKKNLDDYNRALALVEQLSDAVEETEKILKDLTERMLLGVGAAFGKDSSQYGAAGGARKSEVARTMSKAQTGKTRKKKSKKDEE